MIISQKFNQVILDTGFILQLKYVNKQSKGWWSWIACLVIIHACSL